MWPGLQLPPTILPLLRGVAGARRAWMKMSGDGGHGYEPSVLGLCQVCPGKGVPLLSSSPSLREGPTWPPRDSMQTFSLDTPMTSKQRVPNGHLRPLGSSGLPPPLTDPRPSILSRTGPGRGGAEQTGSRPGPDTPESTGHLPPTGPLRTLAVGGPPNGAKETWTSLLRGGHLIPMGRHCPL